MMFRIAIDYVVTAGRYAEARSLLSAGVRPSAFPLPLSVTYVNCIQTAEYIVKLLSRSGSDIMLVFMTPSADTKFQGNFSTHGGSGKIPLEFGISAWGQIPVYLTLR